MSCASWTTDPPTARARLGTAGAGPAPPATRAALRAGRCPFLGSSGEASCRQGRARERSERCLGPRRIAVPVWHMRHRLGQLKRLSGEGPMTFTGARVPPTPAESVEGAKGAGQRPAQALQSVGSESARLRRYRTAGLRVPTATTFALLQSRPSLRERQIDVNNSRNRACRGSMLDQGFRGRDDVGPAGFSVKGGGLRGGCGASGVARNGARRRSSRTRAPR